MFNYANSNLNKTEKDRQKTILDQIVHMIKSKNCKGLQKILMKHKDIKSIIISNCSLCTNTLGFASFHGNLDIVKLLVEYGCDVEGEQIMEIVQRDMHLDKSAFMQDYDIDVVAIPFKPLAQAALAGNLDICEYLIQKIKEKNGI